MYSIASNDWVTLGSYLDTSQSIIYEGKIQILEARSKEWPKIGTHFYWLRDLVKCSILQEVVGTGSSHSFPLNRGP